MFNRGLWQPHARAPIQGAAVGAVHRTADGLQQRCHHNAGIVKRTAKAAVRRRSTVFSIVYESFSAPGVGR